MKTSLPIRAILVDDEQDSLITIEEQFKLYCPEVELIGCYDDAEIGLEKILELRPDVAFVDIRMPKINGLELAKKVTAEGINVVFITAHQEYVLQAIRLSALDYLLKPLQGSSELLEVIEKVKSKVHSQKKQIPVLNNLVENDQNESFSQDTEIALSDEKGIYFYKIEEIIRLEAQRNCCKFYFSDNRQMLVTKNLGSYLKPLSSYGIKQANRSEAVNLKHKKSLIRRGPYLVMNDDCKVHITPTFRENFPFLK